MSTLSLHNLLAACPKHWRNSSYDEKNYIIVELNKHDVEYQNIQKDFVVHLNSLSMFLQPKIISIYRVQHPFAYGRYILRKEQLEKRDRLAPESSKTYIQIDVKHLHDALEYNIDIRRTSYAPLSQSWNSQYSSMITADTCVLVVNGLSGIRRIKRDCEMYPEYIINFSNGQINHFITDNYICY